MFQFLWKGFWKRRRTPQVGETWQYNNGNPWTFTVRILEIKDGWVRYSGGGLTSSIRDFIRMYKFYEEEQ